MSIVKVRQEGDFCTVTLSEDVYRTVHEDLVVDMHPDYLILRAAEKECRYMLSLGLYKEHVEGAVYFKLKKEIK